MVNTKQANLNIQRNILGGVKTPHSTSYPVIVLEDNKYYLAVFTFFYSQKDIKAGSAERPTMWAIADIETGDILEERLTKDKEFSDAPYDVKYNIRADMQHDMVKAHHDEAFLLLDSVRDGIINTGSFCKDKYQLYLDKILTNIPKEYQRFYTDLSIE